MTIRELRNDILYEIENQDQEIEIEDIYKIIGLYNRAKLIEYKIIELKQEGRVSDNFILGWLDELHKANEEFKNYKK